MGNIDNDLANQGKRMSMTPDEYIETRFNRFRNWYDEKGVQCKKYYLWTRSIEICGGVTIPVIVNLSFPQDKFVLTAVSLIVAILISLESVFHFRERWKRYRETEQILTREYQYYATGEGEYRNIDRVEAFRIFIDKVEHAIAIENRQTLHEMTAPPERKAGSSDLAESSEATV